MRVSLETKRRWFRQGAAAWHRAQIVMGVAEASASDDIYVCPLCLEIDYEQRSGRFTCHTDAAIEDRSLTVEHVPPESLGGGPLLLTCKDCNNTAGHELDADARKRENSRDAFLGRVTTKASMTAGGHRLAGSFTAEEGQFRFAVTNKKAFPRNPRAVSSSNRS
jgi:hypothetical protein